MDTTEPLGLDIRPVLINGVAGAIAFLHGQPFSIAAATVARQDPRARLPHRHGAARLLDLRFSTTDAETVATDPSAEREARLLPYE